MCIRDRQREAKSIAGEVDTMLVVGGRHSSNTQKLFEICKKECENTYYIQTPVDLDSDMFQCSSYVGITAGASTPKKIIEEEMCIRDRHSTSHDGSSHSYRSILRMGRC